MPREYLMSWEPKTRRWAKMYRRVRYTISCAQLGVRDTKEASYQAANDWWLKKRAEVDGSATAPPHPHYLILGVLRKRLAWALKHDPGEAERLSASIAEVEAFPPGPFFPILWDTYCEPDEHSEHIWADRLSRDEPEPVPPSRSVSQQAESWLASQRNRAEGGELSLAEAKGRAYYLKHFTSWLGDSSDVGHIDAERWQAFYDYLIGGSSKGTRTKAYAKKIFRTARMFIEHLAELKLIEAPGNLNKRAHSFRIPPPEIETYTIPEVRDLLDRAKPATRLFILLALNCGYTQADYSGPQCLDHSTPFSRYGSDLLWS